MVAGCSCATGVSKLLLLATLRRIAAEVPPYRGVNIVEDITAHIIGGAATALRAADQLREIVQSGMSAAKLPLSWGKTCFLLSNRSLLQELLQQPGWTLGEDKCLTHIATWAGTPMMAAEGG